MLFHLGFVSFHCNPSPGLENRIHRKATVTSINADKISGSLSRQSFRWGGTIFLLLAFRTRPTAVSQEHGQWEQHIRKNNQCLGKRKCFRTGIALSGLLLAGPNDQRTQIPSIAFLAQSTLRSVDIHERDAIESLDDASFSLSRFFSNVSRLSRFCQCRLSMNVSLASLLRVSSPSATVPVDLCW